MLFVSVTTRLQTQRIYQLSESRCSAHKRMEQCRIHLHASTRCARSIHNNHTGQGHKHNNSHEKPISSEVTLWVCTARDNNNIQYHSTLRQQRLLSASGPEHEPAEHPPCPARLRGASPCSPASTQWTPTWLTREESKVIAGILRLDYPSTSVGQSRTVRFQFRPFGTEEEGCLFERARPIISLRVSRNIRPKVPHNGSWANYSTDELILSAA